MARPKFSFEFNNKSENQFTDYQQLLFRYIIGTLALEHDSSFRNGEVNVVTTHSKEINYLKVCFGGVNNSFLNYIVATFPIKVTDINIWDDCILIPDYRINIKNETIRTINISK